MTWHLTMFFAHLVALLGALRLYRAAPCWMQRIFMGMLIVSMAVVAIAYLVAMFDAEYRPILQIAGALEHIGLLIYLFRLNVQGMQWTPSSDRSPSSLA